MEKKMEIVKWLVAHDYHLFGERPAHFAARFSLEQLETFKECFAAQKGITIGDLKEMPNGDDWGDLPTIGELEGWGGVTW